MLKFIAFAVLMSAAATVRAETDWQPTFPTKQAPAAAGPAAGRAKAAVAKDVPGSVVPALFSLTPSTPAGPPETPAVVEPPKPTRPDLKPGTGKWRWQITRPAWTSDDERAFEAFVATIGESDCSTVHQCLTQAASNPRFHQNHPPAIQFFADCADLPFILRGYFAWQSGLPFSFPVRLGGHPMTPGHASRLSGYSVADRYDIVGPGPDPKPALDAISGWVSSEHFRNPPAYAGKLPNDHYPVRITRESIRPGTVIFDPDGHVAVVYKVTDDGRILYIDAHPDNSLTRGVFNREFARAEPPMGAGFKRWRPQSLEGARNQPDGTWTGGRIVLAADDKLADWSDEQFFGNVMPRAADWKDGKFVISDQTVDFHEYVRLRLAQPGFKYDPIGETRAMLRQICSDFSYRVEAVQRAVAAGIDKKPMPLRLPQNIYATQGEWETFSTPSRDARLKTAFEELRDELSRFLRLHRARSSILAYDGSDLRADLAQVYADETASCSVTYVRGDGTSTRLGFQELKRRLFRLSFNPYTCVERRWGADSAEELATCRDDRHKSQWYEAEDRLRNQLVRTYGEKMGWGLGELQNRTLDIGIAEVPDVDPTKVLEKMDETAEVPTTAAPGAVKAVQRQRTAAPSQSRTILKTAVRPVAHKAAVAKQVPSAAQRRAPPPLSVTIYE